MTQDERLAAVETHLECISADVKEIHVALIGNEDSLGFKIRIDRLEQSDKTRSRFTWLLSAILGAGIVERFVK